MTNPTEQPPLPGLEPPARPESDLERAARRTLTSLEAAGYLDERHALLTQGALELAAATADARKTAKAYAVANLWAQLLATFDHLMPETSGGDKDAEWIEFQAELRRSLSALRDAAEPGPTD